ncbi:MAG TPA: DNA replication complex GINS family protein [Methanocorpusculum sp.]|nr:DNA replication complex GINS family protein [Methanocorpusculum sp.]
MPDRISISELHGYLIDERNSGSLTEIPATLYEEVHAELNAFTSEARSMGDPFGEGVQILLKERESLREYIRDLYAERTRKIFSLALAKATGEEINREELRCMVPGERSLYEVVADSATACRKALLDGKQILDTTTAFHFSPGEAGIVADEQNSADAASFADAHADEVFQNGNADAETAPESYRVIMVQEKVEEFQDYSGRCYALSPGDIVSLPQPMAEILCNRNIALNIRLRK